MLHPMWLFTIAAVLFIVLLIRILQRTPGDADAAWERQEARYRQQGIVSRKPDDWEHSYQRSKIGLVIYLTLLAGFVLFVILRGASYTP